MGASKLITGTYLIFFKTIRERLYHYQQLLLGRAALHQFGYALQGNIALRFKRQHPRECACSQAQLAGDAIFELGLILQTGGAFYDVEYR